MFGKISFESLKGNSKEKEHDCGEDSFSEELKLKLKNFKVSLRELGNEGGALSEALAEARIPSNSYDKKNIGNPDVDYLKDTGFAKKIENLQNYLDNINSDEGDSISWLKNYDHIKEDVKYIYDRFNYSGYLSDRNHGGDVLKNDFPEIAIKLDDLMAKMPEIDKMTVSLNNRLYAQDMFKEMEKKKSLFRDKYISEIRYISNSGRIGFNSFEIGSYRTPEELVKNLEKFLDNDLKENINKIQENESFNEEEKNKRIEIFQGLIVGGREYLDEFKKLMESSK